MRRAGGPPWPQLAIVVLLIVGARGPSILCVFAIAMACILATLHAKGLRHGSTALALPQALLGNLRVSAPPTASVSALHSGAA